MKALGHIVSIASRPNQRRHIELTGRIQPFGAKERRLRVNATIISDSHTHKANPLCCDVAADNNLSRSVIALQRAEGYLANVVIDVNNTGDAPAEQVVLTSHIGATYVLGYAPEIHRVLLECFDVVFELAKNLQGKTIARVNATVIPSLRADDVFANPTGLEILKRVALACDRDADANAPPDPETFAQWLRAKADVKNRGLSEDGYKELLADCRRVFLQQPTQYLTLAQATHLLLARLLETRGDRRDGTEPSSRRGLMPERRVILVLSKTASSCRQPANSLIEKNHEVTGLWRIK